MHGIEAAVAAGIVAGCPDRRLEVLCSLTPADALRIREFLAAVTPVVSELETKHPFELVMTGECAVDGQAVTARVHLMERHTGVVSVTREADGTTEELTDRYRYGEGGEEAERADRSLLNVQDIVTFAEEADLTELKPLLERQIRMNMAIAEEGLRNEYGASIGRLLYNGGHCDLRTMARAYAAAGSDARMNGC
jgi:L-cysteine desulfidase